MLPSLVPDRWRRWYDLRRAARRIDRAFSGKSACDAFTMIYENAMWGRANTEDFYSGTGSHDPAIVERYIGAVSSLLGEFAQKPDVVDLGCGDFNVGLRLRPLCGAYVACDIVPALIERNKARFPAAGVDFRCLDMIDEPLPDGDLVFIRQVLQHLSNAQIARIVPKLVRYRYLVVTEHLPAQPGFAPNRDKPLGSGLRIGRGRDSGVVLTARPFGLRPVSERVVCESTEYGGVIRTILYGMRN